MNLRLEQEEYHLFKTIVEQSRDGIYLFYNGKLEYVNKQLADLIQVTLEEIMTPGFRLYDFIAPESRTVIQGRIERFLRGELPESTYEVTALRKDGMRVDVEVSVSYLTYKSGIASLGIVRDISLRKRAQARIEMINRCFLEFVPDPMENIRRLTNLCGEMMEATSALYNRLEGDVLVSLGQWKAPSNMKSIDGAKGHICYDIIMKGCEKPVILRNLDTSSYRDTDPYVRKYDLKTYIGMAVKCMNTYVGALCAVYNKDYTPDEMDLHCMSILASAIGTEEARLNSILDLKSKGEILENRTRNLEELNTALKVLLSNKEKDRLELEEKVLLNAKKLVIPYIEKLKKTVLQPHQKTLITVLENNVKELCTPFSRHLLQKNIDLTHREMLVADMIKKGMTSKLIAEALHVSQKTVDFHRSNIRKKLGILNTRNNLKTYLMSLF